MSTFRTPPQTGESRPINYYSAKWDAFIKKHGKAFFITLGIIVLLAFLAGQSLFIVGEAEQAVVSRFGVIKRIILSNENHFHEKYADKLEGEISLSKDVQLVRGSGLFFKMPFVDKVDKYSARLFNYISSSEVVNTSEKKQYNITTYAQWAIMDPALFSLKLGNAVNAENQLDNLIQPVIVQAINRLLAEDFISNKQALNQALKTGLDTINRDMVIRGLEIKDIQVHRTILPQANVETTYERMKADRAKVAQQLRSEGDQEYQMAVADVDLQAARIKAEAVEKAGTIRAEADAEALSIYQQAYQASPDFFSFWRSLTALKETIGPRSTLVISDDHPLWQQLLAWGFGK